MTAVKLKINFFKPIPLLISVLFDILIELMKKILKQTKKA